jgi:hypothetical protein
VAIVLPYTSALSSSANRFPDSTTIFSLPGQDRLRRMSALVDAASRGDVADVQRLLRERASLSELGVHGSSAMYMAVHRRHTLVVKCLIKEGGADIGAMIMGCQRLLSIETKHWHSG